MKLIFCIFGISALAWLSCADINDPAWVGHLNKPAAAASSSFPTANLVAFYKLNEASGDALDSGGSLKTFTQQGTVPTTSTTIGGESVNARSFTNAATTHFYRADDADFDMGTGNFSIAFWLNLDSTAGNPSGIYNKRYAATTTTDAGYSVELERYSTTAWTEAAGICDGTTRCVDSDADMKVPVSTWVHWIWTFDRSGNCVTYTNNVQCRSFVISTASGSLDNTIQSTIGKASSTAAGTFKGMLSHLGFWKKVLDSSERTALYNSGKVLGP
jgi:hypothetical protein